MSNPRRASSESNRPEPEEALVEIKFAGDVISFDADDWAGSIAFTGNGISLLTMGVILSQDIMASAG
ncbi:MAG: hypothetical protein ACKO5E_11595 [bacterium]